MIGIKRERKKECAFVCVLNILERRERLEKKTSLWCDCEPNNLGRSKKESFDLSFGL